jgi:DNA repair exonuclease SbcCD ATPase subunit
LEDELEELESKVDVYSMIPIGEHYEMKTFKVIPSGIEDQEYAVGDSKEVQDAAEEYVEQLIDDIGYMGFSKGFADSYIDEDEVARYAEDFYEEDVSQNPEVYFNDEDRNISDSQEEEIEILKSRILKTEQLIETLEETKDGENDEEIEEKVDELNEKIEEMNDEITDIESSPDGEFPQNLIDEKVEDLVSDVRHNVSWFMEEFGLNAEDYIDKDAFIQGVIDADGYGIVNGYDGSYDEVYVQDILFYVMRID